MMEDVGGGVRGGGGRRRPTEAKRDKLSTNLLRESRFALFWKGKVENREEGWITSESCIKELTGEEELH